MKNSTIIFVIFISFFSISFAQEKGNVTEVNEYYNDTTHSFFLVSKIIVDASDKDDADFLSAALKAELIHTSNILIDKAGDTLVVKFVLEHQDKKDSGYGRNGKWGEVSIAITSQNGQAASAARDYVSQYGGGGSYYEVLMKLTKKVAGNFIYQN